MIGAVVTASTGTAAMQIGGITIHRFAALCPKSFTPDTGEDAYDEEGVPLYSSELQDEEHVVKMTPKKAEVICAAQVLAEHFREGCRLHMQLGPAAWTRRESFT